MAPAPAPIVAVEFDATFALWRDRLPENWSSIAGFYLEAVADVPADLVSEAFRRLRLNYRYPGFPKPADLRATVLDEMAQRRTILLRLKTAQLIAERAKKR